MDYYFYVGTYTNNKSKGIYIFKMDEKTGKPEEIGFAANSSNPSYLAISPDGRFLYSANELSDRMAVSAYSIEKNGALSIINERDYPGAGMCYLDISRDGKYLAAAGYNTGHVLSIGIEENGAVGELISCFLHSGSSVNKERQESQHAHCAVFDSGNNHVVAADLGTDTLYCYRFDKKTGELSNDLPYHKQPVEPGQGPRHIVFNRANTRAFLLTELGNKVIAYDYKDGEFCKTQELMSTPNDFIGESTAADIRLSPDEKFLYASNRGSDTITCYACAEDLLPSSSFSVLGKTPRNFAITPNGKFLISANQDSHQLIIFSRHEQNGGLEKLWEADVPSPACVMVLNKEKSHE